MAVRCDTSPALAGKRAKGHMVLQAAMLGQGAALTRTSLAELVLASGLLVKPREVSISHPRAHYLVCLQEALIDRTS